MRLEAAVAALLLLTGACARPHPPSPSSGDTEEASRAEAPPGAGASPGGPSPTGAVPPAAPPTGAAKDAASSAPGDWARATLARLSLEQKAGQLVFVRANGLHVHPSAPAWRRLLAQVGELQVGGLVVFDSEVDSLPRVLNALQRASPLPLLVAADMERGLSFRVRRGVVSLPYAMAVGAARSEAGARFTGEVAAREGRALGIHWALAPVADVNSNPDNPVINIRSYGEDPEWVARLAAAFVAGARSGGLLTSVKHFPGHGDTAVDSHLQLATLAADRERLERVELKPFRAAIAAGVDSVMLGHVAVPALDPSGAPATLSPALARDLLRGSLGFAGLVVTDALEMKGVDAAWTGEAAIRAVRAGADAILLPAHPEVAVQALVRAVREGQLAPGRLDDAVLRLLAAKERLALHERRLVDETAIAREVDRPEDEAEALELARRSITFVRNEGGMLPLRAEAPLRLLHLVLSSDARNRDIQGIPEEELEARRVEFESLTLGPEVSPDTVDALVAELPGFSHVLVSAFVRVTGAKGTADMSPSHARLLRRLGEVGRPLAVVSYGSPYLLRQFPELPVYVCAYGSAETSQRAAMSALFGEFAVSGKLPVTLPGLYPAGHGLEVPKHPMTLRTAAPEEVGFRPAALDEVDRLLEAARMDGAFPGAVVAVGKDGALVKLAAYGRLTYEAGAAPVRPGTLYDLASLTKVVATTTAAMILVDEERLDLDRPLRAFVPGFAGGARDRVTVRQLLTHSSGIEWWAPLYQELRGQPAFLERILAMDLVYEPGTQTKYSDLGLILLGEVLERVAGEPLEAFVRRRVFEPLRMEETLYRPGPELLGRIAPTEWDPWRGRVVHGEVHDENAFALGGVAPHAGLFGTAPDLARFAQMLLNGGVLEHQRVVSRATLESFTRRADLAPRSTRALGWDTADDGSGTRSSTPGTLGYSSAGSLFSATSFGHTGFTGTSLWVDPERRLFVILLTNRVHPTRENDRIRAVRATLADTVVRALREP